MRREIGFAMLALLTLILGAFLVAGSLRAMVDPACPDDGQDRIHCPRKIEIQYRAPNEPALT